MILLPVFDEALGVNVANVAMAVVTVGLVVQFLGLLLYDVLVIRRRPSRARRLPPAPGRGVPLPSRAGDARPAPRVQLDPGMAAAVAVPDPGRPGEPAAPETPADEGASLPPPGGWSPAVTPAATAGRWA